MDNNPEKLDRLIRLEEAAETIGYSKSWIYSNRDTLQFVVVTPSGGLRVSVARLKEWMDSCVHKTTMPAKEADDTPGEQETDLSIPHDPPLRRL